MLEIQAVARVLYSKSFKAELSGIYIDEAHVIQEIGTNAPLVATSATLPARYRKTLEDCAALSPDYTLINLGNYCLELFLIVPPFNQFIITAIGLTPGHESDVINDMWSVDKNVKILLGTTLGSKTPLEIHLLPPGYLLHYGGPTSSNKLCNRSIITSDHGSEVYCSAEAKVLESRAVEIRLERRLARLWSRAPVGPLLLKVINSLCIKFWGSEIPQDSVEPTQSSTTLSKSHSVQSNTSYSNNIRWAKIENPNTLQEHSNQAAQKQKTSD
ncbi:hypothetical protein CVT24_006874 [Panaeolus cyanescens]|uniref:Uncharacterized protein n=1 Tax=Panaeolus cyanescens TaxID=181874 RepID=A0A409YX01_9AGAR|nr:hypothetical protein CVT24_006874 [Panaeolus cyanescens]